MARVGQVFAHHWLVHQHRPPVFDHALYRSEYGPSPSNARAHVQHVRDATISEMMLAAMPSARTKMRVESPIEAPTPISTLIMSTNSGAPAGDWGRLPRRRLRQRRSRPEQPLLRHRFRRQSAMPHPLRREPGPIRAFHQPRRGSAYLQWPRCAEPHPHQLRRGLTRSRRCQDTGLPPQRIPRLCYSWLVRYRSRTRA
jgi:hypothetical protein